MSAGDLGRYSIDLPTEPDSDLASDLKKQGGYVSPLVRSVDIAGRVVTYELAADITAGARDDVHQKMSRYVQLMVNRYRKLPRKVVHERERRAARPLEKDVFAKLEARGWVRRAGAGQIALSGPALAALRAVDEDARAIAMTAFAAREEAYPSLIPSRVLARCGYFSSFPQSVCVVTHLAEDFDGIETFRRAHSPGADREAGNADIRIDGHAFAAPECCLSPALCYHCYAGLEGARLGDGPHVATTVGKCFRYESINMTGLERLWDFTMREIVFVGTEDEVLARRARAIELVEGQLEKWDLAGRIETANDPFFAAAYASKSYAQLRGELKFELRLPLGDGGDLACASFNLHDNFFGRTFAIGTSDGQPAFTGCVGWGLERWVLALFTQHGFERADWPAALRDAVWA